MEEEGEIMGYRPRDEMIEPRRRIIAVHPTVFERSPADDVRGL